MRRPGGRRGRAGHLPEHVHGPARRPGRRAPAPGRRLHGHRARLGAAHLRARERPLPAVPRGLRRAAAAPVEARRVDRDLHARGGRRVQRRARGRAERRGRRRAPPVRHDLPGRLPRAPRRLRRRARAPARRVPDHAARGRPAELRARRRAVRRLPDRLRRPAAAALGRRPPDRHVLARGPRRLPRQARGRRPRGPGPGGDAPHRQPLPGVLPRPARQPDRPSAAARGALPDHAPAAVRALAARGRSTCSPSSSSTRTRICRRRGCSRTCSRRRSPAGARAASASG